MTESFINFFRDQLTNAGILLKETASMFIVRCPFHDPLNSDSCRVNKERGFFNCFNPNCREHGNWNKLAEKCGMQKINFKDPKNKVLLWESDINNALQSINKIRNISLPELTTEYTDDEWRGIPKHLLDTVGAKVWMNTKKKETRIIFPVYMYGKLIGWSGRLLYNLKTQDQEVENRHIHSSGFPTSLALFPYDLLHNGLECIVIVEGIHDSLNLLKNGIPSLCIFGANSWTISKQIALLAKTPKHIFVMGDGDLAGREMNNTIIKSLKQVNKKSLAIYVPDECDPGDLDSKYLSGVKKYIYSF